jgi:hypothetical protein
METSSTFSIFPHSALSKQTLAFSLHFSTSHQPLCAFQVTPLCLGQGCREEEEVLETLVQEMELALMCWMTHWCMEPGAYGGEDVFELLAVGSEYWQICGLEFVGWFDGTKGPTSTLPMYMYKSRI